MPFWPKDNDAINRAIEQADTLGQQIQYGLYAIAVAVAVLAVAHVVHGYLTRTKK